MTVSSRIALGFAILRGFQLAALTVPWLLQKVRRADATESERSLVLMIGSRSILLGLAIVALALTNRRETLGAVLIGDGVAAAVRRAPCSCPAQADRRRTAGRLVRSRCVGGDHPPWVTNTAYVALVFSGEACFG